MITSELISYIVKQIENNISKDLIISKLIGVGWHREDVDEAFSVIETEEKKGDPLVEIEEEIKGDNKVEIVTSISDKYREPIPEENFVDIEKELPHIENPINEEVQKEVKKIEIIKTEAPLVVKEEISQVDAPKIEVSNSVSPVVKEETSLEVFNTEIPAGDNIESKLDEKVDIEVESVKRETPKIWTPMKIPIVEEDKVSGINTNILVKENVAQETGEFKVLKVTPKEQSPMVKSFAKMPDLVKPKESNIKEELIPTLSSKPELNSFGYIMNKDNEIWKEHAPTPEEENVPKESLIKDLPKIPMISTYGSDLLSVNKQKEENIKKKGSKIIKIAILVIILILVAGSIWAFISGRINIGSINIPFVKKDPKVLLLNNSKVLSSLKSYKTETNIKISSPSFANISSGLINSEEISQTDKDSITVNTLGTINQNENGLVSDNFVTITSSLLQSYISTDIKNDSKDLFISIPNLEQILKQDSPEPALVKINEQQFNLIPSLFSPYIGSVLQKINLYKILSSGMPSYINKETLSVYDEFINGVVITEKGTENIKGIDTYHYSISTNRQLSKKLLTRISDNFSLNLADADKELLNQILGSVMIDSFEVWIGKGDNNIYQYNVVMNIPLSKILGLEDKSIGDNKVSLDWKTTYYDFNISNNISIPTESIPAVDFVNGVKELKIKNTVSSFKQLATALRNAEGSYGKNSNISGSCMNPTAGSLFSPVGHTKGSTAAVSSISMLMNDIFKTTNGIGSCYSTTKTWSFTIPISDNYDLTQNPTPVYKSYFCVDNTGTTKELITPPTGVVCK